MKKTIERVVIFVVSILVPIAVFGLTYRREAKVVLAFTEYIVDTYMGQIFIGVALLAGFWIMGRRSAQVKFLVFSFRHPMLGYRWALVLAAVLFLVFLGHILRMEYRVFSEIWYSERALEAIKLGKLLKARLICDRYLELFPQRTPEGSYPDPVCVPLRAFLFRSGALRAYISRQQPAPARIDGLAVGVAWETRREALRILDLWSGGVTPSSP